MADREPHWYRAYLTSTGYSAQDQITDTLPAPGGSTLTRLHYQFQGQSRAAIPFGQLPIRNPVLGVIARDASDPAAVPPPLSFPSNDWLHYELLSFTPVMYTIGSPTYVVTTYPGENIDRDVKAQRTFETGIELTWAWESNGVGNAIMFVQLAYEALVLWPEGLHSP